MVKLNGQGKIQWDKTIGGSGGDWFGAFKQAADGGYLVGGESFSDKSGDKTENSKGQDDYWVVKLNSLGKIQWNKTIGGNSIDVLKAIQNTRDGGYILGGLSGSDISGDKTEHSGLIMLQKIHTCRQAGFCRH